MTVEKTAVSAQRHGDHSPRSIALDATRAWGTGIVFLVHIVTFAFGFAMLAAPGPDYGTLDERIDQWKPSPLGVYTTAGDLLRWSMWLLGQSVGVFVLITATVLTLAACRRGTDFTRPRVTLTWWFRRLAALYPMWILAHVGLASMRLVTGQGPISFGDPEFWWSVLGVRFTPAAMWYGVPAWWYVGLLIGTYLVFPAIFWLTGRLGVRRTLLYALPVTIGFRLVGNLALEPAWVEPWSHGTLLIGRTPEMLLGAALGRLAVERAGGDVDALVRRWERPWVWASVPTGLVGGSLLGLFLAGTALSTVVGTVSATVLFMLIGVHSRRTAFLDWMSSRALAVYLVHQVPIFLLIGPTNGLTPGLLVRTVVAALVTVVAVELLYRVTGLVMTLMGPRPRRRRPSAGRHVASRT